MFPNLKRLLTQPIHHSYNSFRWMFKMFFIYFFHNFLIFIILRLRLIVNNSFTKTKYFELSILTQFAFKGL